MNDVASAAELLAEHQRQAVVASVQKVIAKSIDDLDAVAAIDHPLLWAARCSLDAVDLLLRADLQDRSLPGWDAELVVEAVGAARASVGAATHAAQEVGDRRSSGRTPR